MNSEAFKCEMSFQFLVDPVKSACGQTVCYVHLNEYHKIVDISKDVLPSLKFNPILAIPETNETVRRMSNMDPNAWFMNISRI